MSNEIDPDDLTEAEMSVIQDLRDRNFAVTIWTPRELELLDEGMCCEDLEDAMCEYASNFIGNKKGI